MNRKRLQTHLVIWTILLAGVLLALAGLGMARAGIAYGQANSAASDDSSDSDLTNVMVTDILTSQITFNNTLTPTIYLPLINKPRPGINGRVTVNSSPASGVSLELRFYNGSDYSTRATTSTDSEGYFLFAGMPSLGPGQWYYVRYLNDEGTPGRLWVWGTRLLTSYAAGSVVGIGNFDIADIALVSPAPGATVSLPYTFQWTRRPATPSDSYEFNLNDPNYGDPWFWTDPSLGYVGSYTLNSLPGGFSPGVQYAWFMWVFSPDGGYGISYYLHYVTFSNTGSSVMEDVRPVQSKSILDLEGQPKR